MKKNRCSTAKTIKENYTFFIIIIIPSLFIVDVRAYERSHVQGDFQTGDGGHNGFGPKTTVKYPIFSRNELRDISLHSPSDRVQRRRTGPAAPACACELLVPSIVDKMPIKSVVYTTCSTLNAAPTHLFRHSFVDFYDIP